LISTSSISLYLPEKAGLAAGVVTSTLQIGAAVGVAAIGSVFFGVLNKQTIEAAYGEAFASALAVAAVLQAVGIALGAILNRRQRLVYQAEAGLATSDLVH
jgi:hypothetical protein